MNYLAIPIQDLYNFFVPDPTDPFVLIEIKEQAQTQVGLTAWNMVDDMLRVIRSQFFNTVRHALARVPTLSGVTSPWIACTPQIWDLLFGNLPMVLNVGRKLPLIDREDHKYMDANHYVQMFGTLPPIQVRVGNLIEATFPIYIKFQRSRNQFCLCIN